jgi:hypothetical protein
MVRSYSLLWAIKIIKLILNKNIVSYLRTLDILMSIYDYVFINLWTFIQMRKILTNIRTLL